MFHCVGREDIRTKLVYYSTCVPLVPIHQLYTCRNSLLYSAVSYIQPYTRLTKGSLYFVQSTVLVYNRVYNRVINQLVLVVVLDT